ncbi:MAG: SH3 domain-containing protein [Reinekea sp.]
MSPALALLCSLALMTGCTTLTLTKDEELADVQTLVQQPAVYTETEIEPFSTEQHSAFLEQFKEKYFSPWFMESVPHTVEESMWGKIYFRTPSYGENKRQLSSDDIDHLFDNANFEKFDTERVYAITVAETNLRVFPSKSVIFKDPARPGEGFPFDYNQATLLAANTPLFISHYSKDGLWALVESNITQGWISVRDFALVDAEFRQQFMSDNYATVIQNRLVLKHGGQVLFDVGLGTLLTISDGQYRLAAKKPDNYATFIDVDPDEAIQPLGLPFNSEYVDAISHEMVAEPYGWGGLYHHRDCSMLTRDFFLPFGIFLNRNSVAQLENGQNMDLTSFSDEEKKQFLLEHGQPFKTLLYLPGHILLYVGQQDGEPIVFHSLYSIKTDRIFRSKDYKRIVVGKAVVTTLELGKERDNYNVETSLLRRIKTMVIIQPDETTVEAAEK